MKVLLKISLKLKKELKTIFFGIPENDEVEEMYRLRYRNYLLHDYIEKNDTKKDIDEYDDGRSAYFIAKVDDKILGCVRMIKDYYLPTEKDCFQFDEPKDMKKIERNNRAEVSRLIVEGYSEKVFLPTHLVILGLFYALIKHTEEANILAGYSFIKKTLKIKLNRLKFPFHKIEKYIQIYKGHTLKKYFSDPENPVIPIYYLTSEVRLYINKIFNKRLLFKKQSGSEYIFIAKFLWNLYRKFLSL